MSSTIIINRSEIKGAVGPGTDHYGRLSTECQAEVTRICAKGLDEWTHAEALYMASMAVRGSAC